MRAPTVAGRALALAALAALPALAAAADGTLPLWELGVGLAALHLPHYRGSDQSHNWLLPVPYGVYRGEILRANRDGARAVLLDGNRLDFDLSVSVSAPVRSTDNHARTGMADLPATLEIGPNLNAVLARGAGWKLDLRLPVHAAFTVQRHARQAGWTASPVLNLDTDAGPWHLGLQGGPRWGSLAHHALFYGVDAADATADRPAYAARSGNAGWRITAAASRRWGDCWLGAFVMADSLAGAVFETSPLVRQRQTYAAGFALSWVLKVSDERVPRRD
jgi:outer membrane scaffolding protein for murein synthesis (MipA/OmpV family)